MYIYIKPSKNIYKKSYIIKRQIQCVISYAVTWIKRRVPRVTLFGFGDDKT